MPNITDVVIYQLKVVLLGISPMIWRRLLVRSDHTIADLHYILQIALGWIDTHLHQFRIHGKRNRQLARSPADATIAGRPSSWTCASGHGETGVISDVIPLFPSLGLT
jgi:hypothetical protein